MIGIFNKSADINFEHYPEIVYKYRIWDLDEPENRIISYP